MTRLNGTFHMQFGQYFLTVPAHSIDADRQFFGNMFAHQSLINKLKYPASPLPTEYSDQSVPPMHRPVRSRYPTPAH